MQIHTKSVKKITEPNKEIIRFYVAVQKVLCMHELHSVYHLVCQHDLSRHMHFDSLKCITSEYTSAWKKKILNDSCFIFIHVLNYSVFMENFQLNLQLNNESILHNATQQHNVPA